MLSFVKNLFRHKQKGAEYTVSKADYAAQRKMMDSPKEQDRLSLANDSGTHKEILYYLAEKDPSSDVREAVARNIATPVQASKILVVDKDKDVRMALAGRLVDLLPDLSEDKHSQLYAFAVQTLGTLALDEVLKVRVALSSTLKDHMHAPPKVAAQLARDVEREVSEPILRFCAALSDVDLIEILKGHPASWAIEAVAERLAVSAPVSRAVIGTDHRSGGKALIENDGADMDEALLRDIVAKARDYPEWQRPVASRAILPAVIAKELASFVDASVRDVLLQRDDFEDDVAEEIAAVFRRRVDFATEEEESSEALVERVKRFEKEGRLNEQVILDALAMRERDFVNTAIARLIRVDASAVEKIFGMKAAKSIVALAWHAGFSMRTALQLQKDMGLIAPNDLIYPRDGSDYPLSDDEILWQLEFLGLRA